MSRADTYIRFPLAAAMLAAMGTVAGGSGREPGEGQADETCMVSRGEVPVPALESIVREAGGLDFGPVTVQRREHGVVYQADMVRDGHATGVEVDAAGTVHSVTTEVEAWELPLAVKRVADAETLGFPARSFVIRSTPSETVYLVDAATERRGKQLEIDAHGRVLNKVLKVG